MAQEMLIGISDCPGQSSQDPMLALIDQAHQARSGQDERNGVSYMTVPF
jgi:hypothetical protein